MANNDVQTGVPLLDTPFVGEDRAISIPWYRFLISLWNRTGGSSGTGAVPTGTILAFGGDSSFVPDGFLLCNGDYVSVAQYEGLFEILGTIWGISLDPTLFRLPDSQTLFLRGAGGGISPGDSGGAASHSIGVNNLPPHLHAILDPGHVHGQRVVLDPLDGTAGSRGSSLSNANIDGDTESALTGITQTELTGSGDDLETVPPWVGVWFIIKT